MALSTDEKISYILDKSDWDERAEDDIDLQSYYDGIKDYNKNKKVKTLKQMIDKYS